MRTIYKYNLLPEDSQDIELPMGAEIISVQVVNHEIKLWALVHPEVAKETRHIRIFGTGHPVQMVGECRFLGTIQMMDGRLIFHIFEYPMA